MCTNSTEYYPITKRLKTPAEEVEKYFPGFMAFIDVTEQQIQRPLDKERKYTILEARRRKSKLSGTRL